MNRRVAEIMREVPGCEVHVVREYADGSLLVLYVPPAADCAPIAAEADWSRVTENTLMMIPHRGGGNAELR